MATSLIDVEHAIAKWQRGESSALAAHDAVARHSARCELTTERLLEAAGEQPLGILRDAVDAGLLSSEDFVVVSGKQLSEVASIHVLDDVVRPADKRRVLEAQLARGAVLVHLDARRAGVIVPPRLRNDAGLVLRIGRSLSSPLDDLALDAQALSATLTFDRERFHCVVPWTAIYGALVEGEQRGEVWVEDAPDDLVTNLAIPHLQAVHATTRSE